MKQATSTTSDIKTKTLVYSRCTLVQGVEMAIEQSYIPEIVDLQGRDLRRLNRLATGCVSIQGRTSAGHNKVIELGIAPYTTELFR